MRHGCDVDQILMIEEFVLFGRHEMTVEPEQHAERSRVVHLDRLVGRLEALEFARRLDENAGIVGQILGEHAGREIPRGVFIRHRALRGGSPGTSTPADAMPFPSTETIVPPSPCYRSCSCTRIRRPSRSRAPATYGSRDATRRAGPCR